MSVRNDLERCKGGACLWKRQCSRWIHRLTGAALSEQKCVGTGTRDEQAHFVEEPR